MTKMFCILSITICSLGPTLANDIETLMTNNQKRVANIFLLLKSNNWDDFYKACSDQSFISSLQLLRKNIKQEYRFQSFIENIENLSGIADVNTVFFNFKRCLSSTILANYLGDMQTEHIDKIPHNVTLIVLNLVTIFTKVLDSYNDELSQLLIISRKEKTDLITIFVNKDSRLADWLIFKLIKAMFTISQKYTELLNAEIKHSYALIVNEYVDEPNKIIYSYLDLYDRTQNLIESLRTNTHSIVEMILKLGNIASVNFFKPELTTELPLEFYYTLRLKFFSRKLNAFFGYIQYANRLFIMFPELDIKDPQTLIEADLLKTTICGHIDRISRNVLQRNFFLHLLSTAAKSRFEVQIYEATKLVGTIEKYILDNIKNRHKLK